MWLDFIKGFITIAMHKKKDDKEDRSAQILININPIKEP